MKPKPAISLRNVFLTDPCYGREGMTTDGPPTTPRDRCLRGLSLCGIDHAEQASTGRHRLIPSPLASAALPRQAMSCCRLAPPQPKAGTLGGCAQRGGSLASSPQLQRGFRRCYQQRPVMMNLDTSILFCQHLRGKVDPQWGAVAPGDSWRCRGSGHLLLLPEAFADLLLHNRFHKTPAHPLSEAMVKKASFSSLVFAWP